MPSSDPYQPAPETVLRHPQWSRNAVLYQINTRQFTAEGTFTAAEKHLPRLADLGATVLWLMPIHPIGEHNRKGHLGSPYAVRDYLSVNPELGTEDDLRRFVATAHSLGMRVILDWVANHTAWDSHLVHEHPEWYARDYAGAFRPTPWWDWEDIIDLDYANRHLREYMTAAMTHWVRDFDVDGFRCDVAGFVPLDFWVTARSELEKIKPVFLLAEWEERDLHVAAFDASYAWSWNEAMHRVASGKSGLDALVLYYAHNEGAYPRDAMRMTFVSNHDRNAWEGTEFEQFGDALEAAIVLSVVGEGIPMIYNGQEAGNPKRLEFFDRDPIVWQDHPLGELYGRLFALKRNNSALGNGAWGARMIRVPNSAPDHVLSFVRADDSERVFAAFNFSDAPREVQFSEPLYQGPFSDWSSGCELVLDASSTLDLPAWGYRVLLGRRD